MTTIIYHKGTVAVDRVFSSGVNEFATGPKMFSIERANLRLVYAFCGDATSMGCYLNWLRQSLSGRVSVDNLIDPTAAMVAAFPTDHIQNLQVVRVVYNKSVSQNGVESLGLTDSSPCFYNLDTDQTLGFGSGGSQGVYRLLRRIHEGTDPRLSDAELVAHAINRPKIDLQIASHLPLPNIHEKNKPVKL